MIFFKRKAAIVTHSGSFHADDAFACAVLALLCEQQKRPYTIIRSRDPQDIENADYVVDVGAQYDPQHARFDHHQPQGAGKRDNGIPYAAFGLVWKAYGNVLCKGNTEVFADIDRRMVQPVDAIDNGISITEPLECGLYDYGIYGMVSAYNNTWREADNEKKQYTSFLYLVGIFKDLLLHEIARSEDHQAMLDLVRDCYAKAEDTAIIEIPYHASINAVMQVLDAHKEVLYVVCRSNVYWKVLCLRKENCGFANRKDLPASWAGKRDRELQAVSGVADAIFCHNARFMATAKTKEGAWQLAKIALQNE